MAHLARLILVLLMLALAGPAPVAAAGHEPALWTEASAQVAATGDPQPDALPGHAPPPRPPAPRRLRSAPAPRPGRPRRRARRPNATGPPAP